MKSGLKILSFMIVLASSNPTNLGACTTILVGKNASADGSVMMGHNEDLGLETTGRLWRSDPEYTGPLRSVLVPYVQVTLSAPAFSYWASGNARGSTGLGIFEEYQPYDSVLVGMNEAGVSMSCNWAFSREEARMKSGIRRYAIRQLILEHSQSALDAVRLIGQLIDTYGQADWGGLIYNVADSKEAWVIETTSSQWVALRVSDDEVYGVANRFTIGATYDYASRDLIDFAYKKGWYRPENGVFSFRDVYGNPERMNDAFDKDREDRIRDLLGHKLGKITVEDVFDVLRDRYEGTKKFTPPMSSVMSREMVASESGFYRPISVNTCQSSSVAHLRGDLPPEIGPVLWYSMANPGYSGYFPIYPVSETIPEPYKADHSTYSQDSAWWTFKLLQATERLSHEKSYQRIRNLWGEHQARTIKDQKMIETLVIERLRKGDVESSKQILSQFTKEKAQQTLLTAKYLLNEKQIPGSELLRIVFPTN